MPFAHATKTPKILSLAARPVFGALHAIEPGWRGRRKLARSGDSHKTPSGRRLGRVASRAALICDRSWRNYGNDDESKPGSAGEPQTEDLPSHTMPVQCARWRRVLRTTCRDAAREDAKVACVNAITWLVHAPFDHLRLVAPACRAYDVSRREALNANCLRIPNLLWLCSFTRAKGLWMN
jgi:hypothetical protein